MLLKLEFSQQIFEKYSHFRFHENSSSENRAVRGRRKDTQTDRQTDSTKLRANFRHITKASKNSTFCQHRAFLCFVGISEKTEIISLYSINGLIFKKREV